MRCVTILSRYYWPFQKDKKRSDKIFQMEFLIWSQTGPNITTQVPDFGRSCSFKLQCILKRRRSKVDVRVTRSGRFGLFSVINDLFYLYFTSFSWFLNLKILLCFFVRFLLLTFLHLCISPIPWNRWSKLVSCIHGLCYCVFLCVWFTSLNNTKK